MYKTLKFGQSLALACFTAAIGAPAYAETLSLPGGQANVENLAKLDNPWAIAYLPDGRLLITEKPGNLRILADGKLSGPVPGVPKVEYHDQGGLLDVAVDPDFAENQLIYLSFTERAETQPSDAKEVKDERLGEYQDLNDVVLKGLAVARGRLTGNELEDLTVIWRQTPKMIGRGHFGGRLVFAPDGKLFITSGDRQRFEPAQDLGSNMGKIVRINSDGSIPEDNPFVNKDGVLPEIWTIGHRNQLGAAINPSSKQLWTHEMGPKGGDEVNIIEKGKNYGWPVVSEGGHYNDEAIPKHKDHPKFAPPVIAWNPSISPSALVFYQGNGFPGLKGKALLGGLSSKALIVLTLDGDKVTGNEIVKTGRRIRDVAEAPDGSLVLLGDEDGAELLRLTPASAAKQG
ncbi:MAG TPA: PQQ-dependent sugar dehydrogenase [Methyloceanibacter sp.]